MSGEIKSFNLLGSQSLFTGNTYPIYLGGSGGVIVSKTPAYSNTYLEITPSGYNTWLDFHCSPSQTILTQE